MKKLAATSVTLALWFSASGSQQQTPAAPPLKLVTECPSEPSASPPPPTGAQLLAQQPSEVQAAIKEHEQDGKWPVYRTAEYTIYPYNQKPEPAVDCAPLRTTDIQLQPVRRSPPLPWEIPSAGWPRRPPLAIHATPLLTWR